MRKEKKLLMIYLDFYYIQFCIIVKIYLQKIEMIYGIAIFKNTEGTDDNSFQKLEIKKRLQYVCNLKTTYFELFHSYKKN